MQFQGYLHSPAQCSGFQLFTDELAHGILGCDNNVCKLSVLFAGVNSCSQSRSTGSQGEGSGCALVRRGRQVCVVTSLGSSLGMPESRFCGGRGAARGRVSELWDAVYAGSPSEVRRPDHHGCGLERVAGPLPVVPLDAVELVCALPPRVVHPVEVGRTTGIEPPACESKTQKGLGTRWPQLSHREAGTPANRVVTRTL